MKGLYLVVIFCLCGAAFAQNVVDEPESVQQAESAALESDRTGRAMGDDDDFSSDFDEFIHYFQRGIRRFINRMSSPEERQATLGNAVPFIGRLIFRSLSYLGSFLVGALAVPPLLAGNALSLFGLYRPNEPNELIANPVLPSFFSAQQHSDRLSSGTPQVNDLSEALFMLGQKNQATQQDSNQAQALLAQAAGSSNPVEISEIVNDLIRVQSNNRPQSLWNRLTSGLSVFLPQVSRQVMTPAGALGSLLFLGTLAGAPYLLNRRSDSGLFGEDLSGNDESNDSSEDYRLELPNEYQGPSGYETGKNPRLRKNDPEAQQAYKAYQQQAPAAYGGDQAYAAAGEHNEIYIQQAAAAAAPVGYSPYQYVNRRSGETKAEKSESPVAQAA